MIFFSFDWSELFSGNITRIMKPELWMLQHISAAAYIYCFCCYLLSEFCSMISIVFGVSL